MLLQSHDGLELLPALPAAWPAGSVSGLRARGGFEVSLAWDARRLRQATIVSTHGQPCVIRGDVMVSTDHDQGFAAEACDGGVRFPTQRGAAYVVEPR
jgi:alpha-L-fucosidase 2